MGKCLCFCFLGNWPDFDSWMMAGERNEMIPVNRWCADGTMPLVDLWYCFDETMAMKFFVGSSAISWVISPTLVAYYYYYYSLCRRLLGIVHKRFYLNGGCYFTNDEQTHFDHGLFGTRRELFRFLFVFMFIILLRYHPSVFVHVTNMQFYFVFINFLFLLFLIGCTLCDIKCDITKAIMRI